MIAPLAFGEVGVQKRIREVLFHQRPTVWGITAAVCLCVVVSVCFFTDPVKASEQSSTVEVITPEKEVPQEETSSKENWMDWYATTEEHTGSLEEDKTDDPKVNLFNQMLNTMDSYNRLDLTMETSCSVVPSPRWSITSTLMEEPPIRRPGRMGR